MTDFPTHSTYVLQLVNPCPLIQWRIQGRGPGSPLPSRRAEKTFLGDQSHLLSKGLDVWMTPPSPTPPLSQGLDLPL